MWRGHHLPLQRGQVKFQKVCAVGAEADDARGVPLADVDDGLDARSYRPPAIPVVSRPSLGFGQNGTLFLPPSLTPPPPPSLAR